MERVTFKNCAPIIDATENSKSFKPKIRVIVKTSTDGNTKNVELAVPLKYLVHFMENSLNAFNQQWN